MWYKAMKERTIVIARGAKSKEVLVAGKFDMFQAGRGRTAYLCRLGHTLTEDLDLDVTEIRMQSD